MKAFIIAATIATALTSGTLFTAPAEAGFVKGQHVQSSYGKDRHAKFHHTRLTPSERATIANSKARLDAMQRRFYADGRLSGFERIRLATAQRQHTALVQRLMRY